MRPIPSLLASVAFVLALLGGAGAPSLPAATLVSAAQGAANAAGVVIADPEGGPPTTVCVRFAEESITGKQLLDLAAREQPRIDPVYQRFSSRGHAVCALCGEGCPAEDCFCQSRYWNYNVAHDGQWVRSGAGVDGRSVRHGDVDGWAFGGDGAAPPYIAFESICGADAPASPTAAPPSPTASPPASPSPPSTTPASPPPSPAAPSPPAATPTEPAPSTTSRPTPTPATTSSPSTAPAGAPVTSPAPSPSDDVPLAADDESTGTPGAIDLVAFVVILGAVVALVLRRRLRD